MRKEDVRFGGILFVVGVMCCARYSVQDFIVSELVPEQARCARSVDKPALALAQTQRRGGPRLLAGVGRRVSPHKSACQTIVWIKNDIEINKRFALFVSKFRPLGSKNA